MSDCSGCGSGSENLFYKLRTSNQSPAFPECFKIHTVISPFLRKSVRVDSHGQIERAYFSVPEQVSPVIIAVRSYCRRGARRFFGEFQEFSRFVRLQSVHRFRLFLREIYHEASRRAKLFSRRAGGKKSALPRGKLFCCLGKTDAISFAPHKKLSPKKS